MAKIVSYKFGGYTIPSDPDITSIRVRTSPSPFLGTEADYSIPFDDIGMAQTFQLPLAHTPLLDQNLYIGISAVDDVGNESDILYQDEAGSNFVFPFDLVAPPRPGGGLLLL